MQPNLKVENLGKSYIIGHQRESYTALRDVLANKARQTVSNAKKFFTIIKPRLLKLDDNFASVQFIFTFGQTI